MDPVLIEKPVTKEFLRMKARELFGDFAKAVVDIERDVMMVGGEMHVDNEQLLLENGSEQKNLWGLNLYPDKTSADWIEFDSMINLRPGQGNRSRGVDDPALRERITRVVNALIPS